VKSPFLALPDDGDVPWSTREKADTSHNVSYGFQPLAEQPGNVLQSGALLQNMVAR
jgi:hypothetical protein